MIIIITGNPIDGLFFYGPFPSRPAAIQWAEAEQDGQDWWLGSLERPEDEDDA